MAYGSVILIQEPFECPLQPLTHDPRLLVGKPEQAGGIDQISLGRIKSVGKPPQILRKFGEGIGYVRAFLPALMP